MSKGPHRVAVTGAAGYIGGRLIQRLQREQEVDHILALDIRPLPSRYDPKVVFRRYDVSSAAGNNVFAEHGIDTVVHLAFVLKPSRDREANRRVNVKGAERVFEGCAEAGVRHLIYLSSTTVYGAHADNPPMLAEESPVRPLRGFQYGEDKADAERALASCVRSSRSLSATVLRACPVLGPNADNFISRAFTKPLLVGIMGQDPPIQLLHENDLAEIITRCSLGPAPGVYNVAGEGLIRWSEMARMFGRRLLKMPAPLLYALTGATWALRLQSDSSAVGLDFIRYRWTVGTDKVRRQFGVTFRHSSRDTWESFVRQKRGVGV